MDLRTKLLKYLLLEYKTFIKEEVDKLLSKRRLVINYIIKLVEKNREIAQVL
jgi:hypothetical protein